MSLFITGTGTGVGKTVVTAVIAAWFQSQGKSVCVYKPIQTGSPDASKPEDPASIQSWLGQAVATYCSYCFADPVAPYAADPERTIQTGKMLQDFKNLQKQYDIVLVEGAGGVRVPVAPYLEMIDLIRMFQLPVVVVAHPQLGTINHTLLTVDALLAQRLEVKGVVISDYPGTAEVQRDPAIQSLFSTLEPFLPVPVLGTLPHIELTLEGFQEASAQLSHWKLLE